MCDWPQLKYSAGQKRTKNNIVVGEWEEDIFIQCGKCYTCRARKLREWVFRVRQECILHPCSHFVTLTYDSQNIPITTKGFMTLNKKDVQLFIRYLRRTQTQPIKYLAVGEYGTNNKRPHYHILLFGCRNPENIYKTWQKGLIHIGQVEDQSIAYTLEYITVYEDAIPDWKDIQPVFRLQSTKIGANWLESGGKDFLQKNIPTYLLDRDYKMGIPKYYRDKVYNGDLQDDYRNAIEKVIVEYNNKQSLKTSLEVEKEKRFRLNKLKTKKSKKS